VKQIAVSVALLMITGTLMFAQSAIGDVEQSIKSMENEMREAVLKGDAVGSAKYLGSNYVRVCWVRLTQFSRFLQVFDSKQRVLCPSISFQLNIYT
jgi:hypothetical protein